MNILCVIDSLASGGAQRQLVGLAKGFKKRGHEVSFLVYHKIDFFKKELDEAGIQVHSVIEPNYLKRLFKMRRFIRNGRYDAVLSFLGGASFISEMAGFPKRKWKLLVGERSANPRMFKSLKLRIYKLVHLFADYVVANSDHNIKMVRRVNPLLSAEKCRVIYNLINLEDWKPDNRLIHNKTENTFSVIILARHHQLKNLQGLIEAINLLSDDHKNSLRINWYGEDFKDGVKASAEKKITQLNLNHVFAFHGQTLEINTLIHKADAVGMFSLYEGLPNSVCEGMAAGKPIIAAAVSDVPLLVQEGVNGFLCNPNDPNSIANAIKKAMNCPPEKLSRMGLAGREKAEMLFAPEKIVDQYLQLFSQ